MDHKHIASTRRIEAFSDGVFAIIVTLLVLDLKVPDIVQNASVQFSLTSLLHLLPQFISFALSFVIVCIFWVNHHEFFSVIKAADHKFLWLNNLTLFWLCFVPFPTAFIGRNPTNVIAVMLFGSGLFLAALSFSLMISYVFSKQDLLDEHISDSDRKIARKRGYLGVEAYALSILLAPLSVYISLAIFILVPLYDFIPRRLAFA